MCPREQLSSRLERAGWRCSGRVQREGARSNARGWRAGAAEGWQRSPASAARPVPHCARIAHSLGRVCVRAPNSNHFETKIDLQHQKQQVALSHSLSEAREKVAFESPFLERGPSGIAFGAFSCRKCRRWVCPKALLFIRCGLQLMRMREVSSSRGMAIRKTLCALCRGFFTMPRAVSEKDHKAVGG